MENEHRVQFKMMKGSKAIVLLTIGILDSFYEISLAFIWLKFLLRGNLKKQKTFSCS